VSTEEKHINLARDSFAKLPATRKNQILHIQKLRVFHHVPKMHPRREKAN
jgi:hypothetical protein